MKAVILAGGKGRRLHPYTTNFPKPLMPVGDKPILELVIERLRKADIREIIITTGHLENLIRAFFQDGSEFGVDIEYSRENEPLGTAGPINLVRQKLTDTFLVMNGDVLTDLDFHAMLEQHRHSGNLATIALSHRKAHIDFGVVELDDSGRFKNWIEKPDIDYLVSAGIYFLEPAALNSLPNSGFFNLPDLIQAIHADEGRVGGYTHDGYWLDIGRPDDYEQACADIESLRER
jgi:NDP-mannose synthase